MARFQSMHLDLILYIVLAGVLYAFFEWFKRWRAARSSTQRVHRSPSPESKEQAKLAPESRFIIRLTETEVICERPDGKVERVEWGNLQKVEVMTTSDGPFAPDVYWVLYGTKGGCVIPQGAQGEQELLTRLQELPGFDNGALIAAMGCTDDKRFLCWQKPS